MCRVNLGLGRWRFEEQELTLKEALSECAFFDEGTVIVRSPMPQTQGSGFPTVEDGKTFLCSRCGQCAKTSSCGFCLLLVPAGEALPQRPPTETGLASAPPPRPGSELLRGKGPLHHSPLGPSLSAHVSSVCPSPSGRLSTPGHSNISLETRLSYKKPLPPSTHPCTPKTVFAHSYLQALAASMQPGSNVTLPALQDRHHLYGREQVFGMTKMA